MTRREVVNFIYKAISPCLTSSGFKLCRKQEGFVRQIHGGRQVVGLAVWDYRPRFDFSMPVSIRLDQAADIGNALEEVPEKWRDSTMTCVIRSAFFTGGAAPVRISSEQELAESMPAQLGLLQRKILPFLEGHQDVPSIDQAMNGVNSVDTSDHPGRGIRALIVAHLAGNPEFDRLVEKYRAEMAGFIEPVVAPYEKAVRYLRELREGIRATK